MESLAGIGIVFAAFLWAPMIGFTAMAVHANSRPLGMIGFFLALLSLFTILAVWPSAPAPTNCG